MPDSNHQTIDSEALSEDERNRLKEHLNTFETLLDRGGTVSIHISDEEKTSVELSEPLAQVIGQLLSDVARGRTVTVAPAGEELTTQEAADLLNVSRPHLVKLLENGKIPYRNVGSHRRVRRADVLAYKEAMRVQAEDALQELTDQAQELGLGYQ